MMEIEFDLGEFERMSKQLGGMADQLPYALSLDLNNAVVKTREHLVGITWPGHVQVRNTRFLTAALRMAFATKSDLSVAIVDTMNRAHLLLHARSGVKLAAKRLAIPPPNTVTRNSKGVVKGQKPRDIIANTPKRALRVTPRGIFVGQGGRLHLKYSFHPSAQIKNDVPFYEDFASVMSANMAAAFPESMVKAIKTRRA